MERVAEDSRKNFFGRIFVGPTGTIILAFRARHELWCMAFGRGPKVQRGSRRFVLAAEPPIRAQNKAFKGLKRWFETARADWLTRWAE
jgi:hypothetical protein